MSPKNINIKQPIKPNFQKISEIRSKRGTKHRKSNFRNRSQRHDGKGYRRPEKLQNVKTSISPNFTESISPLKLRRGIRTNSQMSSSSSSTISEGRAPSVIVDTSPHFKESKGSQLDKLRSISKRIVSSSKHGMQ